MGSTKVDQQVASTQVQARLRELLFRLLIHNSNCPVTSPDAIPNDENFSNLAVTSIDFLEFALAVEQEFQVSILESIAPDDLPQTLAMWQQQVCRRLAAKSGLPTSGS